MAFRFDNTTLSAPFITKSGFLRCDSFPTRTGVLVYKNADGSERRELRHPDDVFNEDSLASLAGAPVTEGHQGLVSPATVRSLRVGAVVGEPTRSGKMVRARLQIDDERLIKAVRDDKAYTELSCGYRCNYDPTPGVYEGQRYDGRQTGITYDHVALCKPGTARAGAECAMRLDSTESDVLVSEITPQDPTPAQVSETKDDSMELEQLKAKVAKLEADLKAQTERADALDATLKAEKVRADSAEDGLRKHARKELELQVVAILPQQKFEGMTDAQLRTAVIGKKLPKVRLDGVSEEYLRAMFDAAVLVEDSVPAEKPTVLGALAGNAPSPDARAKMIERNNKAFKK